MVYDEHSSFGAVKNVDKKTGYQCFRADFLSSQKLLAAILLQRKSIMQVLVANILMKIPIVTIV